MDKQKKEDGILIGKENFQLIWVKKMDPENRIKVN